MPAYMYVGISLLRLWAFGDAFGIVHWQCHVFLIHMIMEHLHETPLQGIVGTDKGELFYLLQIEKVSDLVKLRGDLSTAIDLISKNESSKEGTNAINTLNGLLAGLMKYDNDHYEAMDIALADAMKKMKNK